MIDLQNEDKALIRCANCIVPMQFYILILCTFSSYSLGFTGNYSISYEGYGYFGTN